MDIDLDNENNLYNQLILLFDYCITSSYNFIISFYELENSNVYEIKNIDKTNIDEPNINKTIIDIDNNEFDMEESYMDELCRSIGNSLLDDSYEIIFEDNIYKEL